MLISISEMNPKDIVSSIVEAANRKLRGEANTQPMLSSSHVEKRSVSVSSEPSVTFSERNIDQEILLRTKRIETTSRSSPNLAAMQRSADILHPTSHDKQPDRRMAKSQELVDREFSDFDYIDSDKESSSAYLTPNTRYFSDESLLDRNDELEVSHGLSGGGYSRLSRETINSLRRIELEARALREREERRQREESKRKLEKQRIEEDIRQTQQEIEIEDRHSVEDLLNAPQFTLGPEYSRRTAPEPGLRGTNGGRGSSSGRYGPQSGGSNGAGGKYFVVKANTSSSSRHGRPPRQTSVESLSAQSKRTGSLENMAASQSNSQRPLAHVRARTGDERSKRDSCEVKRRSGAFTRTGSMRRGSLDSLIDLLEKRDNRMSWASTDSEEGYDLLTTLTSTFDQKLQTLSSAKLMQSAAAKAARRSAYNNNSSSSSSNSNNNSSSMAEGVEAPQHRLPPQVPLAMMTRPQSGSSDPSQRPYRDPSLHRTPPKPDTKIGLATRFERSSNHTPLYEGHSEPSLNLLSRSNSNNSGLNLQSDVTYSVDNAIPSSGASSAFRHMERSESDSRVSSVMVVISSPSVMSADSSGRAPISSYMSRPLIGPHTSQSKRENQQPITLTKPLEYRPITKSEKTQVNVQLSQNQDLKKESMSVVRDKNNVLMVKSRSASPPPMCKKRSEKRKRRRHTVGGTCDTENMAAMRAAEEGTRPMSAWEQLRPVVNQNNSVGPSGGLIAWLRNERLRASNPDVTRDGQ